MYRPWTAVGYANIANMANVPSNKARRNMAPMQPGVYVGNVGYQKTIANIANILHGSRLDAVGIANIANTVRLLHELTIVCCTN